MTLDNALPQPEDWFNSNNPYKPYDPENPFGLVYAPPVNAASPSILELAKALRDCLKTAQEGISTAPLDELIGKYEWDISDFLPEIISEPFTIDVFSLPDDDDYHPYERTGFGD